MGFTIALRPDEQINRQFSISPRLFWLLIAVGILIAIFLPIALTNLLTILTIEVSSRSGMLAIILLGLFGGGSLVLYALYLRVSRLYILTNQRVIDTIGWLSKRTISAEYADITDLRVQQDIFERLILQAGLLAINTAGGDTEELRFERIDNPYRISSLIRQLCEQSSHTSDGDRRPRQRESLIGKSLIE